MVTQTDSAAVFKKAYVSGQTFAGAELIFAWVAAKTGAFRPEFKAAFSAIGREAQEGTFWLLMLRGVFAGWLIALMAWLISASNKSSEVMLIFILAYVVGLAALPHIIAGSVEVLYTIFTGETSWGTYLGHYMLPTLREHSRRRHVAAPPAGSCRRSC